MSVLAHATLPLPAGATSALRLLHPAVLGLGLGAALIELGYVLTYRAAIPVSVASIEDVDDRVEAMLQERPEKEIATAEVGAFVMQELKRLDKVAYVRFASVYRHFRDIGEFMSELKDLLNAKE